MRCAGKRRLARFADVDRDVRGMFRHPSDPARERGIDRDLGVFVEEARGERRYVLASEAQRRDHAQMPCDPHRASSRASRRSHAISSLIARPCVASNFALVGQRDSAPASFDEAKPVRRSRSCSRGVTAGGVTSSSLAAAASDEDLATMAKKWDRRSRASTRIYVRTNGRQAETMDSASRPEKSSAGPYLRIQPPLSPQFSISGE